MIYKASPIKRQRRSKAELEAIHAALYSYAQQHHPCTVRQLFYAMSVQGIVSKDESGYDVIQRELVKLRRANVFPYHWISDNTRWIRKPRSYRSASEAIIEAVKSYRLNLWYQAPVYVEVWCEKDALAGVLMEETQEYDVPLMVARGFSSDSFLYTTGVQAAQIGKPCHYYYFGDHDPSGVLIPQKVEEGIKRHAPKADIHFHRVAVIEEQISAWQLPTRPTKKTDSRAKNFQGESCELDAIPPAQLRTLVRQSIEQHMPARELAMLKQQEAQERETWLKAWKLAD